MESSIRALRPETHAIKRVVLPRISFIVARSVPNYIIGCENRLPWHLKTDLKNFKRITKDHVVLMGRRTLESIGRALPNRVNVVLTRAENLNYSDIHLAKKRQDALFIADHLSILSGKTEYFIIGGAEIYRLFEDLFDKIYLTDVFAPKITGDAHFKTEFDRRQWNLISEEDFGPSDDDDFPFRLSVFVKKDKRTRKVNLSEYMTEANKFIEFVQAAKPRDLGIPAFDPVHYADLFGKYAEGHRD